MKTANVDDWLKEMHSAGARTQSCPDSMSNYFWNIRGKVKEFSYERARADPAYRQELLVWAVEWRRSCL